MDTRTRAGRRSASCHDGWAQPSDPIDAYQEIAARFSETERDDLFRGIAAAWFGPC
jgi:hypothetical protein